MAVQLNCDALRPVFDWFLNHLIVISEHAFGPQTSIQMLQQDGGRRDICKLINSADISIVDIGLASRKAPGHRSTSILPRAGPRSATRRWSSTRF